MANVEGLAAEIENTFAGRAHEAALEAAHVLSAGQFDHAELDRIFTTAQEFRAGSDSRDFRRELAGRYVGYQLCSLFYEPSTRTRLSFEKAAVNMGMGVVSTENAKEFSSAAKGETIEDTTRVLNEYAFDAIVLRHHEAGAAAKAAAVSEVPIINAGDGKGEHPTQSLLDAFTIKERHGRLDNLKVVMGGDLRNGRTVRSLAQLLATYPGNHISFVSVPELQIKDDIKGILDDNNVSHEETMDMKGAFEDADVVYWTRRQKERLDDTESKDEITKLLASFTIDAAALSLLPEKAIIMHPLPRVDEITTEVDADPRAAYFRQAGNGLYVRMAILDSIFQRSGSPAETSAQLSLTL